MSRSVPVCWPCPFWPFGPALTLLPQRYSPPASPSRSFLDLISAAAPLRLSMEQQSKSAFGLKTQEAVQLGRQAGSNQPLISLLVRAERSPPTIPPHSPPSTIYSMSSGGSLRRLRGHQSERGESARTRHGRQTLSSRRGTEPIIGGEGGGNKIREREWERRLISVHHQNRPTFRDQLCGEGRAGEREHGLPEPVHNLLGNPCFLSPSFLTIPQPFADLASAARGLFSASSQ